jgi:hypothetical protein
LVAAGFDEVLALLRIKAATLTGVRGSVKGPRR